VKATFVVTSDKTRRAVSASAELLAYNKRVQSNAFFSEDDDAFLTFYFLDDDVLTF